MAPDEIERYLRLELASEIAALPHGKTDGGYMRCPACKERGMRYTIGRYRDEVALYANHQAPAGCGLRFQKPEPGDGQALARRA